MDRKEGQTLFEVTPEISHFAELCEKNNAASHIEHYTDTLHATTFLFPH